MHAAVRKPPHNAGLVRMPDVCTIDNLSIDSGPKSVKAVQRAALARELSHYLRCEGAAHDNDNDCKLSLPERAGLDGAGLERRAAHGIFIWTSVGRSGRSVAGGR